VPNEDATRLRQAEAEVDRFLHEKNADRHVTQATIDDAPHFSDDDKKRIVASYAPHELEARTKGVPVLGSGRIFPVPEERITIEHRDIPKHPKIGVINMGQTSWHTFGYSNVLCQIDGPAHC
jgi:hypothetical protein